MERRSFLKWAGLGALGTAAAPLATAIQKSAPHVQPAAGELKAKRWAMVIDTRKCLKERGCTKCIEACDQGHNVPYLFPGRRLPLLSNPKHEVKWDWKEPFDHVFPELSGPFLEPAKKEEPTLVMCNHCDDPPCVRVCPTQATFKRADGIVMQDLHRCIGCRYCMVACPFGSRSFNWEDPRQYFAPWTPGEPEANPDFPTRTKGVVEKCTFCAERLDVGEMPLCVEACAKVFAPLGTSPAMTFGDRDDPKSPVAQILRTANVVRRKPELGTSPNVFYIL